MGYKVIHPFTDVEDFRHVYNVGDKYPRIGMKVSEERLKELSSNKNKQKRALIALDNDDFSCYMNPPEEELPFSTVPNPVKYTKTEINRLSTAELRKLAKENGIYSADEITGSELKKMLIEKFNL